MSEPLALKYRPRTFDDLVGQPVVRAVLSKMVADRTVPSGLLFTGVRGAGKTTSGRVLAAGMNCEKHPVGPCGHCASCEAVFNGTSLDVIEVDAASSGLVADVRKLTDMVRYSVGGEYRVVMVDEAQSMSREGFNALLKTLEEPPENTVFVLLTTEPQKILDTVVSRCMTFEFRKIAVADILSRLEFIAASEGVEVDADLLAMIASRSDGGMRDAVMVLDQCLRAGIVTVPGYREMVGVPDFAPGLLATLLAGDLAGTYAQVDDVVGRVGDAGVVVTGLASALKDVVVLGSGGQISSVGDEFKARQSLSAAMSVPLAVSWMRVLWDVKTKSGVDDSPVSLIYLAIALMAKVPVPSESVREPIVHQEQKRLSLDEMRALA